MWEHLLTGISNAFTLELLLLIFAGTLLGIVIGALPGFSPTMGVALLIPFTFPMSPVAGLATLAAVYSGAVYGGSISAILLNIPGAPANIVTIFDGHPMAIKGEGQKALLTSVISSFNGGFMSAIALILIAPALAIFALKFGPPEKFWVAVLGLVLIANLGTSKELLKGLISGAFGVWLGIIGISPVTGEARFTFGSIDLQGGIALVPALVGIFAFSQALIYFEKIIKQEKAEIIQVKTQRGLFIKTFKEIILKFPGISFLSGVLGVIIGIIPGAGGQVGGIVAYDQAKRFSKHRDQFGKGAMPGLIAPEAANNATVGGALIPMLTLGIPGSPTAAVLLGGLLIHGLWPGPDLFTTNASITYTFMITFALAQIAMLICGAAGSGYFAKVLSVKEYFLGPGVIALCIFGAYAVSNNYFDIYVMLVLGIIAYFAIKMSIPLAPAVLGLILGPIAEGNLMLGMRIGAAKVGVFQYFFTRSISVVIILIIFAAIASTLWFEWRNYQLAKARGKAVDEENHKGLKSMDSAMGLMIFVVSALTYLFYTSPMNTETGLFASLTMVIMAGLGLILFFTGWRSYSDKLHWAPWSKALEVSLVTLGAILLGNLLGFYTATFLLMFYLSARMMAIAQINIKRNIPKIFGFSFGITVFFYLAFGLFLSLPTPSGLFI